MNDFIDDFILEYKNQPCLWQASSVNFKNRKKRQEAYMKLIEIAAKHGEQYNVERTKQKINNLRCAFRHQLKKYTECKNNKGGKDEPYCPKRKYFESLMFLMDEEKPTNRANITDKLKEITVTKISVKKDSNPENKKVPEGEELVKLECSMNMITEALEDHETQTVEEQEIETSQIIEEETYLEELNSEDVSAQDDPNNFNNSNNTNELQIECDEEVNILWPRSSCETKTADTIPINVVSVQTTPVVLPQQKRLKQKPIIQHQQLIQKANVIKTSQLTPVSASIHRVVVSPSSSIITTHGTTPTSTTFTLQSLPLSHQQTISIPVSAIDSNIEERQRSVSHSSSIESSQFISTVQSDNQQPPCKKIKVDCSSSNFEKLLSLACSRINCSDSNEDDYSIFGKMVAYKLRSMERQQSLIAEKIITDILLEGQMKLLNYTQDQQQHQQQSLSTMNRVNLTIPIRNNPSSNSYVISEINNGTADVIHTSSVPQ